MLNGKTMMANGRGSCCVSWLSGVGTTRGTGWSPEALAVRDDLVGMLSMSVSARRALCAGGGACAASATGSTVSASPSKKRVMAIWAFHWQFCSKGTAESRSWSVTEVYCWRASCCASVRADRSIEGGAMLLSVTRRDTLQIGLARKRV